MKYYHFTPVENTESIGLKGILKNKKGKVFLAQNKTELKRQIAIWSSIESLKSQRNPMSDEVTIYEIDSKQLGEVSETIQKNVLVYYKNIPVSAIINTCTISRERAINDD